MAMSPRICVKLAASGGSVRNPKRAGLEDITPEMLIVLAFVEAKRLKQGNPSWCRKHFVGRARKILERPMLTNVIPIDSEAAPPPQKAAQAALANVCRACKGCDMAGM